MYLFVYLYFFIYMIPWTEQGTPWINKNLGSQPRRSFLTVLFSPLGRTASVVVPTGLTQTYGFEKKTLIPYKTHQNQAVNVWFIPKPLSMAVFIATSQAAGRWDKLLVTSTPIVVTAGSRHYQSLWAKHDWWRHALYQSIIFFVGKGGCVSLMMVLPFNLQTKRDFSDDAW